MSNMQKITRIQERTIHIFRQNLWFTRMYEQIERNNLYDTLWMQEPIIVKGSMYKKRIHL